MKEAEALSVAEAEKILSPWLALGRSYEKDVRKSAPRSSCSWPKDFSGPTDRINRSEAEVR
jgi:hypothetical protein